MDAQVWQKPGWLRWRTQKKVSPLFSTLSQEFNVPNAHHSKNPPKERNLPQRHQTPKHPLQPRPVLSLRLWWSHPHSMGQPRKNPFINNERSPIHHHFVLHTQVFKIYQRKQPQFKVFRSLQDGRLFFWTDTALRVFIGKVRNRWKAFVPLWCKWHSWVIHWGGTQKVRQEGSRAESI